MTVAEVQVLALLPQAVQVEVAGDPEVAKKKPSLQAEIAIVDPTI